MSASEGRTVSAVIDESHWTARALCARHAPDALFVEGAAQREARSLCRGCPVQMECLADALDNRMDFGVWGGMTRLGRDDGARAACTSATLAGRPVLARGAARGRRGHGAAGAGPRLDV